jgi:AcrR family transcriptional regulator
VPDRNAVQRHTVTPSRPAILCVVPSPAEPRPLRTPIEQQIVEAAEESMLARGVPDLRVSDIVEETGTSVGTIYAHFGSKAGLIAAVIEDIQGEVLEYAFVAIDHDRDATWSDLIEFCVRYERIARNDFRSLMLVGQFLTNDGERDEYSTEVRQRLLHRLGSVFLLTANFIERLAATGQARPVDHMSTAGWLYSSLTGAAVSVSHMPPWLGDTDAAQTAIFRTQRQMLAQALLPVHLLDEHGAAPREHWIGNRTGGPLPRRAN